jgi:hypothetical protein
LDESGGVLIQSAGLPKIDDVDRDHPDEDWHPVLKTDPEKGEVLRQELEKVHGLPPSRPAVQVARLMICPRIKSI